MAALAAALLAGCVTTPPKEEVKADARPAVVVSPEVRADFDAAMVAIKAEEYAKGIELLGKVVEKSQNIAVPYINLAMAHAKLGNLPAAEENLKLALNIEPDHPVANNEYAMLYRKTGRFAEARQLYESLLQKYPYYPLVHKNLGILCDLYLRDYACSLREYESYSSAVPEDKNAQIWVTDAKRRAAQ